MILRYYLVAAQYWVHQVSSTCPTTPENEMGQSNSGTEMSIYTLVVQVETDDMKDFKWTSTKYTPYLYCHQSHDQTKLALYDSGKLDGTNHQGLI